jgi:hypothetical protein
VRHVLAATILLVAAILTGVSSAGGQLHSDAKSKRKAAPEPLYLSPTGSDSGNCTKTAPCASFDRAYRVAKPGQTVLAAGGTYPAQTIMRTSPQKPAPAVVFKAARGGTVTVNGVLSLGANNGQLSGDSPSYLTFDGININGGCFITRYNESTAVPLPTGLTYQNAHIQALDNACHLVYLNSSDHVLIRNVDLGPMCCDGDAVELGISREGGPSPSHIVLDRLYIHDIYDSCRRVPVSAGPCNAIGYGDGCRSCDHVDGIQVFGGHDVTISNSRVYAINPGGLVGQDIFFAPANGGTFSNITLQNNMVDSTANNDTSFVGPGRNWYSGYIRLLYNTFRGDLQIYPLALVAGTEVTITGNIIGGAATGSPAPLCSVRAGDGTVVTPKFSHNLIGNVTCSASDLRGTAQFISVDPHAPDLHLARGSLGIGRGAPRPNPAFDIDKNLRPRRQAPDIGADQREPARVFTGVGIGAVRFGATEDSVRNFYGNPAGVRSRKGGYRLVTYKLHRGRLAIVYQGSKVVAVGTTSAFYELTSTLQVGSKVGVARSLGRLTWTPCRRALSVGRGGRLYVAPSGGRRGKKVGSIWVISPAANPCSIPTR